MYVLTLFKIQFLYLGARPQTFYTFWLFEALLPIYEHISLAVSDFVKKTSVEKSQMY